MIVQMTLHVLLEKTLGFETLSLGAELYFPKITVKRLAGDASYLSLNGRNSFVCGYLMRFLARFSSLLRR